MQNACNFIGQTTPKFSEMRMTPGMEAEDKTLAGPLRASSGSLDEEESCSEDGEEEDVSSSVRGEDSCFNSEMEEEARNISAMIQEIQIADGDKPTETETMEEVCKWLTDLALQEENVLQMADRNPADLVEYLTLLEEEHEAEEHQRMEEEKRSDLERQSLATASSGKERYKAACGTVEWLEKVVEEAKQRTVSEKVNAKLVDALRVAVTERKDVAPTMKQKSIVDFFKPQSS